MSRVIVWADSGPSVGLGHVARCSAVAQQLAQRGARVGLLTPAAHGVEHAQLEGIDAIAAGDRFGSALQLLRDDRTDILVLDSYRLQPHDYAAAREAVRVLVVFDDHARSVPACDVVVNGAPGAEIRYDRERGTDYLLGATYFPLRKEFRNTSERTISAPVEQMLITAGGEDQHGLLGRFAQAVRDVYTSARITVVSGTPVDDVAVRAARAEVSIAPRDYPARVRAADLIVCGAGQSLIEAVASGTPAVAVVLGEDQVYQHRAVIAAGAAADGGSWTMPAEAHRGVLRSALESLRPRDAREQISRRGPELVDGEGAGRIAEVLVKKINSQSPTPNSQGT